MSPICHSIDSLALVAAPLLRTATPALADERQFSGRVIESVSGAAIAGAKRI